MKTNDPRRRWFTGLGGLLVLLGGVASWVGQLPALEDALRLVHEGYRLVQSAILGLGRVSAIWLGVVLLTVGVLVLSRWRRFPENRLARSALASFATLLVSAGAMFALAATLEVSTATAVAHTTEHQMAIVHRKNTKKGKQHKHKHPSPGPPAGHPGDTGKAPGLAGLPSTPSPAPAAKVPSPESSSAQTGPPVSTDALRSSTPLASTAPKSTTARSEAPASGSGGNGGGAGDGGGGGAGGNGAGASGSGGNGGGNTVTINKSNEQQAQSGSVYGGGTSGPATNNNNESITIG